MLSERKTVAKYPSKFFNALFGRVLRREGLEVEIRCLHMDEREPVVQRSFANLADLRAFWSEALRLNRRGYNIFFGVVPRNRKNHKLVDPTLLTCLWTDVDLRTKAERAAFRKKKKIVAATPPTIAVSSGHGLHLYYFLGHPIETDTQGAKLLLRVLATRLNGDPRSAEPARILRVPNTMNWKSPKNPVLCKTVEMQSNRRYSLYEVTGPIFFPRHKRETGDAQGDYFAFYKRHVKGLRMTNETQAIGLCPFHDDHRPSFSLRITDGVWNCFGCGTSGNAASFARLLELDPADAPFPGYLRESKAFAVENGGYVAWKRERKSWRKIHVCDFTIEWDTENRISDKMLLEDRVYTGNIVTHERERIPIRMSNKDFCANQRLYEVLRREGGRKIAITESNVQYLRDASLSLSSAQILRTNMDFGFQDDDTFLTPSLEITKGGIKRASQRQVDLSGIQHAYNLDLQRPAPKSLKELLRHLGEDLLELQPHGITFPLLGFLGEALLLHLMDEKTRYALWVVGPSGSGKSFIAKLFQCFFGNFEAGGRVASWSSTTNALQYMGYFFKDCIFLVDDYKPGTVSEKGVVQFLQNYADYYGRSRITADIKSRKDYFVRGSLLSTGEDMPSGQASVIARSMVLSITKREPDIKKGERCLDMCSRYPAVTARYVRFLLRRDNLRESVQDRYRKYHAFFLEGIAREENSVRIARNLALNLTGFYWFTRFLKANRASLEIDLMRKEHQKRLLALRDEMIGLVQQEQPGEVFLETIAEGLTSGACHLQALGGDEEEKKRLPCVGLRKGRKDSYLYLYPREAMSFVRSQQQHLGRSFDWSANAVSKALRRKGALVWPKDGKDAGTRVSGLGGKTIRAWKIRREFLEAGGEAHGV